MFFLWRRLLLSLIALAVLTVIAAMRAEKTSQQSFRVTFGNGDKEPTDWSGTVSVNEGAVQSLTGWRFQDRDRVEGLTAWHCRTHSALAPGARYPLTPAKGIAAQVPTEPAAARH